MKKRLRLGMIGGGQGAFIGAVHRIASRIDDRYELVAGCLSSSADKALLSAKEIGIDSNRSYPDFKTMAESEASREDGIQVVSIVTPNHMHATPAIEFIKKGNFDEFCKIMNEHWTFKKKRSKKMSNTFINSCYEYALNNGAKAG